MLNIATMQGVLTDEPVLIKGLEGEDAYRFHMYTGTEEHGIVIAVDAFASALDYVRDEKLTAGDPILVSGQLMNYEYEENGVVMKSSKLDTRIINPSHKGGTYSYVTIQGKLVASPRVTGEGKATHTAFTIVSPSDFKRNGQTVNTFIDVVAFGKTGEFVRDSFDKSQPIIVCGHVQNRTWEKDGTPRTTIEINARNCYFSGGGKKYRVDKNL